MLSPKVQLIHMTELIKIWFMFPQYSIQITFASLLVIQWTLLRASITSRHDLTTLLATRSLLKPSLPVVSVIVFPRLSWSPSDCSPSVLYIQSSLPVCLSVSASQGSGLASFSLTLWEVSSNPLPFSFHTIMDTKPKVYKK